MDKNLEIDVAASNEAIKHGWCWLEKAKAMAQLIEDTKPSVVVEIGVFGGKSMVPQAIALKHNGHGIIYGIDPWSKRHSLEGETVQASRDWIETVDYNYIHSYASEMIWAFGVQNHAVLVRCPSHTCSGMFGEIDILHIDGNHSEESSTRDVSMYLPKVKMGGYIWFDDMGWFNDSGGTMKTALSMVREHCEQITVLTGTCECGLFKKTRA